jgi:hypothetical protein
MTTYQTTVEEKFEVKGPVFIAVHSKVVACRLKSTLLLLHDDVRG